MASISYAGLSPQDALALWFQNKQAGLETDMVRLAEENPAAWQLVKTGTAPQGDTRQIFNTQTGQWDPQEVKGAFSHPETWLQLGLGAGLGGVAALGPTIGGASATGAGGGAGGATAGAGGAATAAKVASGALGAAGKSQSPSLGQEALAALAGIVPGLIARSQSQNIVPPELTQLMQNATARTNYQNPLFQAASQQAFAGLPNYAKQGLSMPGSMPIPQGTQGNQGNPNQTQTSGGGSGMNPLVAGGLGAVAALSPQIISGLKKLFSGGGVSDIGAWTGNE